MRISPQDAARAQIVQLCIRRHFSFGFQDAAYTVERRARPMWSPPRLPQCACDGFEEHELFFRREPPNFQHQSL